MTRATSLAMLALAASILTACDREKRELHDSPVMVNRINTVRLSPLQPGPATPDTILRVNATTNAFAIAEGQKLFSWFNCSGCHSNGGGGMGPALMDDMWIYGSEPENIYRTIVEGRPNGMPSFAGKIPDSQIWKLVAYVRTLGGLSPMTARASRSDHMMMYPGSQIMQSSEQPKRSSLPPAAITP
jgi:cytochrome c oxidase cbb3-type subunit III